MDSLLYMYIKIIFIDLGKSIKNRSQYYTILYIIRILYQNNVH